MLHVREDISRDIDVAELFVTLLLHPRVIVGFLSSEALISLPVQQTVDEGLGRVGDTLPDGVRVSVGAAQDTVNDFLVALSAKGRLTGEHDEQNDAHGPVVALSRIAALEHLGCDVVRGAIRGVHYLILADSLGEAEINQLDMRIIVLLVQQKVLRLDVSKSSVQGFNSAVRKNLERVGRVS